MSDTILSAAPNVGRMIVTLQENGTGRPLPSIEFDPVGRFTPGLIDHYQTLFYERIEQAHAATRAASRASPPVSEVADVEDTVETTTARRRA